MAEACSTRSPPRHGGQNLARTTTKSVAILASFLASVKGTQSAWARSIEHIVTFIQAATGVELDCSSLLIP